MPNERTRKDKTLQEDVGKLKRSDPVSIADALDHSNGTEKVSLSNYRFPRQLEADHSPEVIRQALMDSTVKLWPGGDVDVPLVAMTDALKAALQVATLKGQIRCGLEGVSDKLTSEKAGIANVRERGDMAYGDRISRLVLFSNDGAERFYRHAERLLRLHAPRLLGCLVDTDSSVLGRIVTGKEKQIKLLMVEHKNGVSGVLRAILTERGQRGTGQSGTP
jgi:hypothetical protein